MQLGVDGCFVGSGIFKSNNPKVRAKAMVQAVTHYNDPVMLAKISENLGAPMVRSLKSQHRIKIAKQLSKKFANLINLVI